MDKSFLNKDLTEASDHSEEHSLGTGQLDGSKLTEVERKASLRLQEQSGGKTQVQSKNPSEETSATVLLDDRRGDTVMDGVNNGNNMISSTDHDVNPSNSKKGFLETRKDNIVCMQVVGKLLDRVSGSTNLLKVGTFGEDGFGNLDESKQGTYPDKDSGVHSGLTDSPARPTLNIPDETALSRNIPCLEKMLEEQIQTDVDTKEKEKRSEEENQTKEDPKDREDLLGDMKSDKESQLVATGQLRAASFTSRLWSHPSKGVAGCGSGGVVAKAANNGRPIPNPAHQGENTGAKGPVLPVVGIAESLKAINQIEVPEGQFYGNKADIFNYVNNIGKATENSGVFLQKFVPLYDIRNGDNFTFDQDYIQVGQFTGRDVRLCKTVTTNHLFVTKWVPFEEVRNVRRLRHPQQVELVLGLQDWFSGVAKIDGIIKRTFRGQEFAEIFMEYCHGGTFRDNIDHLRSLTLTAKWRLSKDVLRVLADLHFETIIHGDLKAENICFRGNDVVLIDFESARHPKYQNSTRVTVLYLPPWMRLCWNTRDFDLLKTIDMWAVGMVLLDVVFDQLLWAREYSQLLNTVCDACNVKLESCHHFQSKLLLMMECRYPEAILPYLPEVQPDDDPVRKRLALLIHGLLPLSGPEAQFTASLASEALEDTKILVKIVKNGIATIPPLVIHKGIKFQKMLEMDDIKKLKKNHPDLGEGMWFTYETRATDGEVKEYCVQKNQALEESCILHVYPPMKPTS